MNYRKLISAGILSFIVFLAVVPNTIAYSDDGDNYRNYFGIKFFAESDGQAIFPGVLVLSIFDCSPAFEAGMQPGDIITHMNNIPVNANNIQEIFFQLPPSEEMGVAYIRDGVEAFSLIQPRVISRTPPFLGIKGNTISGKISIDCIVDQGPAYNAGLKEGDILLKIENNKITTNNFRDLLNRYYGGQTVNLTIKRNSSELTIPVVLANEYPESENKLTIGEFMPQRTIEKVIKTEIREVDNCFGSGVLIDTSSYSHELRRSLQVGQEIGNSYAQGDETRLNASFTSGPLMYSGILLAQNIGIDFGKTWSNTYSYSQSNYYQVASDETNVIERSISFEASPGFISVYEISTLSLAKFGTVEIRLGDKTKVYEVIVEDGIDYRVASLQGKPCGNTNDVLPSPPTNDTYQENSMPKENNPITISCFLGSITIGLVLAIFLAFAKFYNGN